MKIKKEGNGYRISNGGGETLIERGYNGAETSACSAIEYLLQQIAAAEQQQAWQELTNEHLCQLWDACFNYSESIHVISFARAVIAADRAKRGVK